MSKRKKAITPFFRLRFEINDTLEALAHELLMAIQAVETALELGDMNVAAKKILTERLTALKAVCSEDLT